MSFKIHFTVDAARLSKMVLLEKFEASGIKVIEVRNGEIKLPGKLGRVELSSIQENLSEWGISLILDRETSQVEEIKDAIIQMVRNTEDLPSLTTSAYLESRLKRSYSAIAKTFKEGTYTSIEHFVILQKIEKVKELINLDVYTLTEISDMLNYSSVAHLSAQFKKCTGLSPSAYQRIMKGRR